MNVREEATETIKGNLAFLGDMKFQNLGHAQIVSSQIYSGSFEILSKPQMPPGYFLITADNILGDNRLSSCGVSAFCGEGLQVFADRKILYLGQPLCMVAGPDLKKAAKLAREIVIEYSEEQPQLSIEQPDPQSITDSWSHTQGDPEKMLAGCRTVVEAEYNVNFGEYVFTEQQSAVASWNLKSLEVFCPTKNAFHVRDHIASMLSLQPGKISIIVPEAAQDPGEKEVLPMLLASLASLATIATETPVLVTLNNSIRQYPTTIKYKTGLDSSGKIAASSIHMVTDSGASPCSSPYFFRRGTYTLAGAYYHPHVMITAQSVRTNKVPFTRFFSSGAMESFFAAELQMTRLSKAVGMDPVLFRKQNLLVPQTQSRGKSQHAGGLIHDLIDRVCHVSDFHRKYSAYEALSGKERFPHFNHPVRGIGFALSYFGFDFVDETPDDAQHTVKLVWQDNLLQIFTSASHMGHSLKQIFCAIAGTVLSIKPEQIEICPMDTSRVPDSGPIHESHAVTEIGKLIEEACKKIKTKIQKTKKPVTVVQTAITDRHKQRKNLYSRDDARDLAWCAMVCEVLMDPATLEAQVTGIWSAIEAGMIIDKDLARIQCEREIAGGLESVIQTGSPRGHRFRAMQALPPIHLSFMEYPYNKGPLGAKGIGELPSLPVAPAYIAAVSQATGF
ncbi:MAG: xanthine dehydrogenase family protein molybdopterin-binding subunit, partial [Spirochaetaceae bacterium]